jgi:hypothetical protein
MSVRNSQIFLGISIVGLFANMGSLLYDINTLHNDTLYFFIGMYILSIGNIFLWSRDLLREKKDSHAII